jgi:GH15 family glucan-1,4-alpha-glucosidase
VPSRIEEYALIGNCETAALVAKNGSIDWLCLPRFDSGACFAALLGTPENGCWELAPAGEVRNVRRRYRPDSLVLETTFETDDGAATLVDCMPLETPRPALVRLVRGERGQVRLRTRVIFRFDYGHIVPWVRRLDEGGLWAIAGPDAVRLRTDVPLSGQDFTTVGEFTVAAGQHVPFTLTWYPSSEPHPEYINAERAVRKTDEWWHAWAGHCPHQSPWRDAVVRSLLTLKALTFAPTGGIVAAATTSLPEQLGGVRNWDYRYCWLRDATFTLYALLSAGHVEEAGAWREWLLRAVAGNPAETQIMYGLAGERRLTELELDWLPGYERAKPVRIGNAAHGQFQLDVYGEVLDAMYQCRRVGLKPSRRPGAWRRPWRTSWSRRGPSRTRASGRCAARGGTSFTPRSWRGWRWTGPSSRRQTSAWRGRSSAGGRRAKPSTPRCAARASTRSWGRSCSTTGPGSSTPAC